MIHLIIVTSGCAVLSKTCPNLLYFAVLAPFFCLTVKMNHYLVADTVAKVNTVDYC
jgi:hypothetical protein